MVSVSDRFALRLFLTVLGESVKTTGLLSFRQNQPGKEDGVWWALSQMKLDYETAFR